jgi:Ca2+-binding RTX toxin-like protein
MSTTYSLANSLSIETSTILADDLVSSLERSLILAQNQLLQFANSSEFSQQLATAFGHSADVSTLQTDWRSGDYSILSHIEVRSGAELGGAKGAYGAETDRIYLSQDFLLANQNNPEALAAVLLEEAGHRLDARLNIVDSLGDEGAIFSREVQNISTSDTQLAQLQAINDHSIITLDGQQVNTERAGVYSGGNLKAEIKDKIDDLLNNVKALVNNDVLQGLPVLGSKLGLATPLDVVFNGFRDQIISKLDTIPDNTDQVVAVRQALLEVLGSGNLNILRDSNGNGIDINDINVIESANSVTFKLALAKTVNDVNINLDGDIGLNGLGLKLNGTVKPTLDFAWNLEFGVNTTNGFFVNTNGIAPEISIDLNTQFVDSMNQPLALTGSLGFLQLQAKDQGSLISGKFTADLNNPLSSLTVTPKFVGNVNLKLGLDAGFGNGSNLPTIGTDFRLNWGFSPNAGADGKSGGVYSGGSPQVAFNNVSIDMASFFKDFAEPLAKKIDAILEPFNSTFDVLEKAIPILNDFGPISRVRYDKNNDGKVTLVDLILAQTPDSQISETIKTYRQFKELSDNIRSLSVIPKTPVNVGGFDLNNINLKATGFNLSQVNLNALNQTTKTATQILTSLELAVGGQTIKDFTGAIDTSGNIAASKPQFSILTDPQQVFNLLVGKNADFFKYNLPNLNVNVMASAFFPLFGPVKFDLRGMLQAKAQLSLGYDSYGIQEFTNQISQGGIADTSKIFDGVYIDNTVDANGPGGHKSGLVLNSDLGAYASISAGLFSAGVGGGIFGNPKILLTDPNGDGQVRLNEFDPSCIFNPVTGSIFASLNAFVEFDIGLFTIKERVDIEKNVFLDFALGCNTAERARLAQSSIFATTLSNGNLSLNVGPTSDQRFLNGVQGVDDAEVFVVDYENTALKVGYSGVFKNYQNANKIVANGGNENDTIVISDRVFSSVELRGGNEISGRPGDRLFGGSGEDTLFGEGGDDYLYGGAGNDNLAGGNNDDRLNGGAGADTLDGGNGFDTASYKQGATTGIVIKNIANVLTGIEGNAIGDYFISIENIEGTVFNDTIEGSDIGEQIAGDSGDDSLWGGGGDDLLIGGLGKDSLDGGTGNDWASYVFSEAEVTVNLATNTNVGGDADGDVLTNIENLYGSTKADVLVGDAADNLISGFDGDDRIQGGDGKDQLAGQNNNDTVSGEAGDDLLNGDDGNDRLDGGADQDQLLGGKGQDTLIGSDGLDTMDGGEDADTYEAAGTQAEYDTFSDTGINGNDTLRNTGVDGLILNSFVANNGIEAIYGAIAGNADGNSLDFSAVTASAVVVDGAAGDDVITGTNQDDRLSGGAGKDIIVGLDGKDLLDGGAENDSLTGGTGLDTLIGGDGLDTLNGNEDGDLYEASGIQAEFDIFNDTGTTGIDTLKNTGVTPLVLNGFSATNGIDAIIGSIVGNANNNVLDFSAITASGVVADGATGDDVISGGTQNDDLRGSEGKDSIVGGAGNDFLDGGIEQDTLMGGVDDDHLRTFDLGSIDLLDGEAGYNRLSADYSDQNVDITFIAGQNNSYTFSNGETALNFQTLGDFNTSFGNDVILLNDDYSNTINNSPDRFILSKIHTGAGFGS